MRYSPLLALTGLALSASLTLGPGAVAAEPPSGQVSIAPTTTLCRLDGTVWDYATGHVSTNQKARAYCEGLRQGEARGADDGRQCRQKNYPLWWPNPSDVQQSRDRGYKTGYDRAYQREWNNHSCASQPQPEPYYPPVH
ncbi:hypothetical protein [Streptomyces sp. WM6372]|uniref:hypothetical protein n=1 Tax=Streptomyces sp. WM6372 TaxID=1415555 RepID=UPI000A46CAB6|nr:hypothetical protein [Streptomyces sp. WM6372]